MWSRNGHDVRRSKQKQAKKSGLASQPVGDTRRRADPCVQCQYNGGEGCDRRFQQLYSSTSRDRENGF
jgi:hypothetical protein